jgi:hypothetical protein
MTCWGAGYPIPAQRRTKVAALAFFLFLLLPHHMTTRRSSAAVQASPTLTMLAQEPPVTDPAPDFVAVLVDEAALEEVGELAGIGLDVTVTFSGVLNAPKNG